MMFICKVKKESKLFTGFPTLHMRLPSLCMQALGLGYSTVWANRAGGQSTIRLWLKTSPQVGTAFPVKRKTLLNLLYSISLNSIIQGRVSTRRFASIRQPRRVETRPTKSHLPNTPQQATGYFIPEPCTPIACCMPQFAGG